MGVDIKGTFNNVITKFIYDRLLGLWAPSRIICFVSFLISFKTLFFSSDSDVFKVSRVGVPQGGGLSPLIFNLPLSEIQAIIHRDIKWLMFAEDLILKIKTKSSHWGLRRLKDAVEAVSD